jgi:hypothetical protein
LFQKGFEWCWKREKALCKKVVQKGACLDRGLDFCMSCLMSFLIVCLVIFAVAWLVSNDWDCLMSLWKNHALFLIMGFLLSCPRVLSCAQFCPSTCLKPSQGARMGGITFSWPFFGAGKWGRCWCPAVDTSPLIQIIVGPTTCPR